MIVTNRTRECPFCGLIHKTELIQCPYCMKPEIKTGEKIMKFDPKKVLTVFTKDEAKEGDWGWFGDSEYGLIQRVGAASYLQELKGIDKDTPYIFRTLNNGYEYFYPAPYKLMQKAWVEKNDLKVGDSVYISKGWKKGEKGFDSNYTCDVPICQSYWVTRIYDDCMVVATKHKAPVDNNHDITKFDWCYRNTNEYFVPYFALEKVTEPTYAEQQAKWVKENKLKVGDKVKIVRSWKIGEKGFLLWFDDKTPIGKEVVIDHILEDCIVSGCIGFPYFAIEKIKELAYAERQAEWVKENDLKVGDLVTVTLAWWLEGEKRQFPKVGEIVKVTEIRKTTLVCVPIGRTDTTCDAPCYHLHYYGIKKVKYRPFANAKEFEPHKKRWLADENDKGYGRVLFFSDVGVILPWIGVNGSFNCYKELLDKGYTFVDTGEPAGVKL